MIGSQVQRGTEVTVGLYKHINLAVEYTPIKEWVNLHVGEVALKIALTCDTIQLHVTKYINTDILVKPYIVSISLFAIEPTIQW
jgi:hypothetical protein